MITLLVFMVGAAGGLWWVMRLGAAGEKAAEATRAAEKESADAHARTVYVDERAAIQVRAEEEKRRLAALPPDALASDVERMLNDSASPRPPTAPPRA